MVIHSALPEALETAAAAVLGDAGVEHVPHGGSEPFRAAVAAAEDPRAGALLGPFRSADVNDALAVTAPAGLALIAPVATWAGVTHDDEPGCDDAARHDGTVLRLLARDTEVAARIAADVRTGGRRAFVVAGEHEYGVQLDGQLRMGGLPRADTPEEADLVVLCGLAGAPEIELAAALAPLPVVAFDGVQGAQLGAGRDVRLALPFAPFPEVPVADLFAGVERARRAAKLVADALAAGAADRSSVLAKLREGGRFDAHGDPTDADVWLWRAGDDWELSPDRALPRAG
jgi:hypothetical protein